MMTTYVLSEQAFGWNLHRFADEVTLITAGIPHEEHILEIALRDAEADAPAQVLRISSSGDNRIIAQFPMPSTAIPNTSIPDMLVQNTSASDTSAPIASASNASVPIASASDSSVPNNPHTPTPA
ncbi:MAG TPA: hypothetical protein VGM92_00830 [Candidatus Kapabacteria bacterium]